MTKKVIRSHKIVLSNIWEWRSTKNQNEKKNCDFLFYFREWKTSLAGRRLHMYGLSSSRLLRIRICIRFCFFIRWVPMLHGLHLLQPMNCLSWIQLATSIQKKCENFPRRLPTPTPNNFFILAVPCARWGCADGTNFLGPSGKWHIGGFESIF